MPCTTFCFVCLYQPAFCRVCVFVLWTSCLLTNKHINKKISVARGGGQTGHLPSQFWEISVILCCERRFSKQNSVIRLKFHILVYTAEYWQYTLRNTVYTFLFLWSEGKAWHSVPRLRTLVVCPLLLSTTDKLFLLLVSRMQVVLGRNVVEHMVRIIICSTQGRINEREALGKVVTTTPLNA